MGNYRQIIFDILLQGQMVVYLCCKNNICVSLYNLDTQETYTQTDTDTYKHSKQQKRTHFFCRLADFVL